MGLFGPSYHGLCEKAKKASSAGDLQTAIDLLSKAIRKDPAHPRAYGLLAMAYQDISHNAFKEGDSATKAKFAELSVKAFDEAIRRETDPEMKAEDLWQKACVLGGAGRQDEQAAVFAEANKLIPGFIERRRQSLLDAVFKNGPGT